MEILFALLFLSPYIISLLLTYTAARFLYFHFLLENYGRTKRFILALSIFIFSGFVIRKSTLFLFGSLLHFYGIDGSALGELSMIYGILLGIPTLVLWWTVTVYFAFHHSKLLGGKTYPQYIPNTVSDNSVKRSSKTLLLFVALALSVTLVVPLVEKWYIHSTQIGNFLASTFNEPRFCKIISYEGFANDCAESVMKNSEMVLENQNCNYYKKASDLYNTCTIEKAVSTNDVAVCSDLTDYQKLDRAECYRNFVGTDAWSQFCREMQDANAVITGRCLTTENVNKLFPVMGDRDLQPAWFSHIYLYNDNPKHVLVLSEESKEDGDAEKFIADLKKEKEMVRNWLKTINVGPNTRDSAGRTALMSAMKYQSTKLPERAALEIIDFGIDLDAKDSQGNTAYSYAVRSGNIAVLDLMLSRQSVSTYKPLQADLLAFLQSDDSCGYNEDRYRGDESPFGDTICIYSKDWGENALKEYIKRGWLEKYDNYTIHIVQ